VKMSARYQTNNPTEDLQLTEFEAPRKASPAPLTPIDCDLRGLDYMPLDVRRLRDSDLVASVSAEGFRCAVLLWCAAWEQVPAASLPSDDRILAQLAGFGRFVAQWQEIKEEALRGFVQCSDGRWYHPVIAEKACQAWEGRQRQRAKANKRWSNRDCHGTGEGMPRHGQNDAAALPSYAKSDAGNAKRNAKPKPQPQPDAAAMPRHNETDAAAYENPCRITENGMQGRVKGKGIVEGVATTAATPACERAREAPLIAEIVPAEIISTPKHEPQPACDLLRRCLDAAGPGLADPAKVWTLTATAPRIALWLKSGADLELDVLPTIARLTAKHREDPIANWSWFDKQIAKSVAMRAAAGAPLAPHDPNPAHHTAGKDHAGLAGSAIPYANGRGSGSLTQAVLRARLRREGLGAPW